MSEPSRDLYMVIAQLAELNKLTRACALAGYEAGLHHRHPDALPLPPPADKVMVLPHYAELYRRVVNDLPLEGWREAVGAPPDSGLAENQQA
jgi:predicted amidophosphoribosyltransferase